MDRRWMVVACIVLILVVAFGGMAGCRAVDPDHWSFTISSWSLRMLGESTGGPEDGVFGVCLVFGFMLDVLVFPVTGIRDLIWILSEPPANSERSTASPTR